MVVGITTPRFLNSRIPDDSPQAELKSSTETIMTVETSALELILDEFSFPTSLVLSRDGSFYIAESGLAFDSAPPGGRIWHVTPRGDRTLLVENLRAPVNGLTLHEGRLYVSEGGYPGRISHFA